MHNDNNLLNNDKFKIEINMMSQFLDINYNSSMKHENFNCLILFSDKSTRTVFHLFVLTETININCDKMV